MKILTIILRIVLGLFTVTPILGALGIFSAPTAEMYSNPNAYAFIQALYTSGYIIPIMAIVFFITLALVITNRMALAAILILPITINIVAFHAFLDGGLFTMGALMADVLLIINIYFIWKNWGTYRALLVKSS
jgi:hypothetical protein